MTQRIRVLEWLADGRAYIRFEVEDTGTGIAAEDRERIFTPFVQGHGLAAAEPGTGLGLAISRQNVELMGGKIGVISEVGKGSTFYCEIPMLVLEMDALPIQSQQGRITGLAEGQSGYRLLIAEDQPANRLLLRKLLDPLGFMVREAVNGREAVALAAEWSPDLIWMDIRMPEMGGMEATRRIRALPNGREMKIVALTAHALEDERHEILGSGCDDFLRKPFRDTEIYDALERHLGVRFTRAGDTNEEMRPPARPVCADEIRILPAALLHQLTAAVESLDAQVCYLAIAPVEAIHPELAARLRQMIDDLQYRELLAVLDEVADSSSAMI